MDGQDLLTRYGPSITGAEGKARINTRGKDKRQIKK
jgi:hypothetical protein